MNRETINSQVNIVDKARDFAKVAHKGQVRKGSGRPFFTHLERAVEYVRLVTDDKEVIAATYLHDILEDTEHTEVDISSQFGERVLELVKGASEERSPGEDMEQSWEKRKLDTINKLILYKGSNDQLAVIFADKAANLLEMYGDLNKYGVDILNDFNASAEDSYWYYSFMINLLRLKDNTLLNVHIHDELDEALGYLKLVSEWGQSKPH